MSGTQISSIASRKVQNHEEYLVKESPKFHFPFLRYPGGKQRLTRYILPYILDQLNGSKRYVEPFAGGAAIFFATDPHRAVLSDINPDLIDLYIGIKKSPKGVWRHYRNFPDTREGYYQIRSNNKAKQNIIFKAARLLYLNRTCFKGMWRQNRRGEFNIGYGGQDRRWVVSETSLTEVSRRLRNTSIICGDFEPIIKNSEKGDFLYIDPPYRPSCKEITESHYVASRFRYEDQIRLAKLLQSASLHGVKWAMTNSSHPSIIKLYGKNTIIPMPKGTGSKLGQLTFASGEVLICNF